MKTCPQILSHCSARYTVSSAFRSRLVYSTATAQASATMSVSSITDSTNTTMTTSMALSPGMLSTCAGIFRKSPTNQSAVAMSPLNVKKRQQPQTPQRSVSSKRVRSGEQQPRTPLGQLSTGNSQTQAGQPATSTLAGQPVNSSVATPKSYVGQVFMIPQLSDVPQDDPILSHPDFGLRSEPYSHPCVVVGNENKDGEVLCFQITSFGGGSLTDKYSDEGRTHSLRNHRAKWLEIEVPGYDYAKDQNGVRVAHDDTPVLDLASRQMQKRSYVTVHKAFSTRLSTLISRSGNARLTLDAVNTALKQHNLHFSGEMAGAAEWMGVDGSSIKHLALPLVDATSPIILPTPRSSKTWTPPSPPSSPVSPGSPQTPRTGRSYGWGPSQPQTPPSSGPSFNNRRYQSPPQRNIMGQKSWRPT